MPLKSAAPPDAHALYAPEPPAWLTALRHLGAAVLAVVAIAVAVYLLALPVAVHAQGRPELRQQRIVDALQS